MRGEEFREGLVTSVPIALGYLAVSFAFGIHATATGLSPIMSTIISLTSLSSSGQFAGVGIMAAAGSYVELALAVLTINLRYILMSLSLTQKIAPMPLWHKLIIGYAVTDEIYAAAIGRDKDVTRDYYVGLMLLPVLGWTMGTLLGASLGALLPQDVVNALGIALYCMFIALVVPPARKDRSILRAVLLTAALSLALAYLPGVRALSAGWRVILLALAVPAGLAWRDTRAGGTAV